MKRQILMAAVLSGLVMAAGAASADNHRGDGERPDFATLDLNGDGALSLEELQAQGQARFDSADANGDGGISADEMVAAAGERAAERAERMIERFDENGDGILQMEEMPRRGGDQFAERMFDRIDENEDGAISAEEFEAAKERMEERRGDRGKGPRGRG